MLGNLFTGILSIYKIIKTGDDLLNDFSMEILTQSNNQLKFETETFLDRASRENYFEKLEVALRNLSIIDRHKKDQIVLVEK